MRTIFYLIFIFVFAAANVRGNEALIYWSVSSESSLEIHGTTNVNSFVCSSDYSRRDDLLTECLDPKDGKKELSGEIYVDVYEFDCQNRIMNNDFRSTLQADEYPEIKISFLELREVSRNHNSSYVKGWVEITLAGKTKMYPVSGEIVVQNNQSHVFSGEQKFRFTDFGLQPPQKGFGMIRVQDEITVKFSLGLEKIMITAN